MRIVINVKPNVVSGTSKDDILGKLNMGGCRIDKNGSRYSVFSDSRDKTSIIGINFEKHRKKVKILKNGKRKIITRGHWIAYVYNFTKFSNIVNIQQNNRNFSFTLKK